MARRSRSSEKGPLWRGYRRPVWRDGVFWLAVATSIAGLLVQNAFGNFEATTSGWLIFGLEVVITFVIVFALIGVLAGTPRGFGEGWRQAERAADPRPAATPTRPAATPTPAPAPAPAPEPAVDEPLAEPAAASEPAVEPEPEPEPARAAAEPTDRPKVGIEMERQARRLGRAFAAGRRTYKKYDDS